MHFYQEPNILIFLCRDTAAAIIKSNYWQEALRNHTLDLNTGRHDTPMRKLVRRMPGKTVTKSHCIDGNSDMSQRLENHKWI